MLTAEQVKKLANYAKSAPNWESITQFMSKEFDVSPGAAGGLYRQALEKEAGVLNGIPQEGIENILRFVYNIQESPLWDKLSAHGQQKILDQKLGTKPLNKTQTGASMKTPTLDRLLSPKKRKGIAASVEGYAGLSRVLAEGEEDMEMEIIETPAEEGEPMELAPEEEMTKSPAEKVSELKELVDRLSNHTDGDGEFESGVLLGDAESVVDDAIKKMKELFPPADEEGGEGAELPPLPEMDLEGED